MEDLEYIIRHGLHCTDDMCFVNEADDCMVCKAAFRRGYNMANEKRSKYQWHDLRKNPEDLPTNGKEVLAMIDANEYLVMRFDSYDDCWDVPILSNEYLSRIYGSHIVKWKYIEDGD